MSIRAALLRQFLIGWAVAAIAAQPPQELGAARMVRIYGPGPSELVDLSSDGNHILAQEARTIRCTDGKLACRSAKLVVYQTETGQREGELATQAEGWNYFSAARFTSDKAVNTIQTGPGPERTIIEWNPFTATKRSLPLVTRANDSPVCLMDDSRVMQSFSEGGRPHLNLLGGNGGVAALSQPNALLQLDMDFDCRGWRSGQSFLLEGAESDSQVRLYWVSANANPHRACWTQSDEQLYGHAISPDGNLAIAITGGGDFDGDKDGDGDVLGANHHVFLNVIRAGTCENLRKVELQFPNKPEVRAPLLAPKNKYLANALLASVFAKRVAVSPDNTKVAIPYGIRTGGIYSDAVAYFGIYSLLDGRRLATLKGDVFRNGVWQSLRHGDMVPTRWAPIRAIFFSPDSRTIYAGFNRIWQWDISALR